MAKKSKLLSALDAHKGRDFEAEKKRKQVKVAEKRKKDKATRTAGDAESDDDEELERTTNAKLLTTSADDDFAAFSDNDKENINTSTNGTTTIPQPTDPAEASASEAEQDSDIPLSDLSDSELEDTIPHQRLTINNGPALLSSRNRIALLRNKSKSTPFHIHNSLISPLPPASTAIPDPNDDLTRELEFYRIARDAALTARTLLKREKIPFTRPADYFAEMVKSDEHMGRVKKKMYDEAAGKKASEEARRQRDAKKFGKAVQVAKEQERAKEKRDTLQKIGELKRKRKGTDTGLVREADASGTKGGNDDDNGLFQHIDIESTPSKDRSGRERSSSSRGGGGASNTNAKRQKKDAKFGFGGKKRFAKSGDAESAADMAGFSVGRMKGRIGGGTGPGRGRGRGGSRGGGSSSRRLGKSRRVGSQ